MSLELQRHGPWAVVTGASSGIGEAFARELARRGFSVVLVARRAAALEAVAASLGVETRCVAVDLSSDDGVASVVRACEGLDVGLVVSNAGTGVPGALGKSDVEEEKRVVRLNVNAPLELSRAFAPRLTARGKGALIFISSTMAFQGAAYMANYAATKAYTLVLGESLHEELKPAGVDVLVVAPGGTQTPGKDLYPVDYSKLPVPWMTPQAVVDTAFSSLGKRSVVVPGLRNHLLACLGSGLWTRKRVTALLAEFARKALPAERL